MLDVLQPLFVIGGIIASFVWFYRRRQSFARANVDLTASHSILQNGNKKTFLFTLRVNITNIGLVRIQTSCAIAQLSIIQPFHPEDLAPALKRREHEKSARLHFNEHKKLTNEREVFVEPGESDQIQFDFHDVDINAKRLGIKVFIENPTLKKAHLFRKAKYITDKKGWNVLAEYDFEKGLLK